jgi:hypothetical protein
VEDYGQYGLDDPACTISLSTGEESYEINLGDFSKMDSQRYVSIGDGNVYLVKKYPLDYYDAKLKDLIDNDDTPKFDSVKEIRFEGAETYNVVYEENSPDTYCRDDVYFALIDGGKLPLDTSRVEGYLKNISGLDLASYNDLRHQEVLIADFEDITQFDISLEGKNYTIAARKRGDETSYYYQGEKLEITGFRKALTDLKAEEFTGEQPAQKEEISLTVHLDNENFPEVRIQLFRYDGTHCLALVDGKPVSLVQRSKVVDLIEAVYKIVLD